MTSIDDLRQRIENEYLEPVTERTPSTLLTVDLDSSAETFTIVPDILNPDEESLLGPGGLLEIDSELVRIIAYNQSTNEIECRRGMRGTVPAAHPSATSEVRFPTRWIRKVVEEAIASSIDALWQPLYVIKEKLSTTSTAQFIQLPLNTVRLISVEYQNDSGEWRPVSSTLFATSPTDDSYASVQIGTLPYDSTLCVIRYGVQIEVPADTSWVIDDLPQHWERIIVADAGAQLLSGVDIDAQTQEVLTQQLRLDRFPVKSGSSISRSLIQYREYLVDLAEKEIKAKYPVKIRQRSISLWGD